VLVLSAYKDDETVEKVLAAGVSDTSPSIPPQTNCSLLYASSARELLLQSSNRRQTQEPQRLAFRMGIR